MSKPEINKIIRQPSLGGFSARGIRKGVKVVKSYNGEWLGYDDSTIFASLIGWSEWAKKSARPTGEWQTLESADTAIERDGGDIYTTKLPAGTRYRLARGGNPHTAALVWIVRPDTKYGPHV